jgi:hypothetical protein
LRILGQPCGFYLIPTMKSSGLQGNGLAIARSGGSTRSRRWARSRSWTARLSTTPRAPPRERRRPAEHGLVLPPVRFSHVTNCWARTLAGLRGGRRGAPGAARRRAPAGVRVSCGGEVPYYTAPHTTPHTTLDLNKSRGAIRQRKLRLLTPGGGPLPAASSRPAAARPQPAGSPPPRDRRQPRPRPPRARAPRRSRVGAAAAAAWRSRTTRRCAGVGRRRCAR